MGRLRGRRDRARLRRPRLDPAAVTLARAGRAQRRSSRCTSPTARASTSTHARKPPSRPTSSSRPSTLNAHRGEIRRPRGASFLNYEGELARRRRPADEGRLDRRRARLRRRLHAGQRRRAARLPPRRPRLDAAGQGPGRLPADRPGGRPAPTSSTPTRLHAAHVPQRRGRPAGRPPTTSSGTSAYQLADLSPPDHARAGRRRPHRHARQLAADGARRRRRGRDRGPRPRSTNTVVDWDVDLAGPGEQLAGLANTLHVALAIPEDEAERRVAEGRLGP